MTKPTIGKRRYCMNKQFCGRSINEFEQDDAGNVIGIWKRCLAVEPNHKCLFKSLKKCSVTAVVFRLDRMC